MNSARVRICIAACMLSFGGLALAAEGDSFLKEAIQGNLGEVKVGALAQQKGTSRAVKDFGATLEKDHAAANRKAISAAQSLGMSPPNEPGPEQKKVYQKLAGLSGQQFDQQFVAAMVEDHRKDIKKYSAEAGKSDGQASSYAQQVLPDLRKHLAMAERIQSDHGAQAPSSQR